MAHSTNPDGQASLNEFVGGSDVNPPAADERSSISPPERTFEWENEPSENFGVQVLSATENVSLEGEHEMHLYSHEVAYLPNGADRYLDQFKDEELSIPQYYSRFREEFTSYVGYVSAGSGSFGQGISSRRLEAGVRIATGGGRFSRDDVTVIGCGKNPAVFRASDGDFLVSTERVGRPEDFDTTPAIESVAGMEIPEEYEVLRDGIEQLATVLPEHAGYTLSRHKELRDGKHVFATEGGLEVKVSAGNLHTLAKMETDIEAVLGGYSYEDPHGETFTGEWSPDEVEYDIGDEVGTDTVIGFMTTWEDPRHNSRAGMSGRVRLKAEYVRLQIKERSNGIRVRAPTRVETVFERRPDGKNYQLNP